jgi:transposase-like protein
MEDIRCPQCGGSGLEKYGKTSSGKQKYRCINTGCGRQFVAGSNYFIDSKIKNIIKQLLLDKVPPKKIAAAVPEISLRWIQELRRRMKNDQHYG